MDENLRLTYRRRLQQRQTVIFGSMAVLLSLLLLFGLLWFTGVLPAPFSREFASPDEMEQENVVPCIPAGTPSVEYSAITVNVHNASTRTGLAGSVAGKLTEQGVTVLEETNWGGADPDAPVVIYSAQNALPQAYSVARMFPSASVLLDGTTDTEVLDIVLGADFTELKPESELAEMGAGQELASPENCVVVDR